MADERLRFILDSIWKGQGIKRAQKEMGGLSGVVKGLGAKLFATVGGAMALNKAAHGLADAAKLAARVETLGVVTAQLGKTAGHTEEYIRGLETRIQSLGITTQGSRQAIARMIQANIDLENSTKLARMAQDAAVIANVNSTEAFNRLVNTIVTGNVRMGRQLGLQLQFGVALRRTADELGKTTDELTEHEQIMAKTNEVLRQGVRIEGTYMAAMKTTGKTMLSLDRVTEELKLAIGEGLLPILHDFVFWLYETIPPMTDAIRETYDFTEALDVLGYSLVQGHIILDETGNRISGTREAFIALAEQIDEVNAGWEEHEARMLGLPWVGAIAGIEDIGDAADDAADDTEEAVDRIESYWDNLSINVGSWAADISSKITYEQLGYGDLIAAQETVNEALALGPGQVMPGVQDDLLTLAAAAESIAIQAGDQTKWQAARDLANEFKIPIQEAKDLLDSLAGREVITALKIKVKYEGVGAFPGVGGAGTRKVAYQHGGHWGGKGPIEVGEAGAEFIFPTQRGYTVVDAATTRKLKRLGLSPGAHAQAGGSYLYETFEDPTPTPTAYPSTGGGPGTAGVVDVINQAVSRRQRRTAPTATVLAKATEKAVEQKIEQSVEAVAAIGSAITRESQEQAQRQIAATERQTRASRETNKLLGAILGAVQAGGTQEGLADSLASAVSLMETE